MVVGTLLWAVASFCSELKLVSVFFSLLKRFVQHWEQTSGQY